MADKERAKKLAAAKKKLAAYKSSGEKQNPEQIEEKKSIEVAKLQSYFINKDTTDFVIDKEVENANQNMHYIGKPPDIHNTSKNIAISSHQQLNENVFEKIADQTNSYSNSFVNEMEKSDENLKNSANSSELLKTIEVLISEKAKLAKETSRLQINCKEKDFEMEEIKTRLNGSQKRIEELEQFYFKEQKQNLEAREQLRKLELELNKHKNQSEELTEHVEELKRELFADKSRMMEVEKELKEKQSQLEMNNIRINQISDENSITLDNRIETLTQTKFMYEQQIVDLQSMVQQLRAEKDQANQQYQNYVQHLNKEINSLNDKKTELSDENSKLTKREEELVEHISNLEKEIQQKITKNENMRQNMNTAANEETTTQENQYKTQIGELNRTKDELNVIIQQKSDVITRNEKLLADKCEEIVSLRDRITNLESERPNDAKLLATIESDKVAASRAMAQNTELRKQLDELQLRLVDLTNDKMDLTNTLDSERFSNKQNREGFEDMQKQIQSLSDQLHFKDEEMIRLSHENNELNDKLNELKALNEQAHIKEKGYYHNHNKHQHDTKNEVIENGEHQGEDHQNCSNNSHLSNHHHCEDENSAHQITESSIAYDLKKKESDAISLPTSEAMCRLEERFKRLMGEVADLTEEKQQLEHLVLQLQGETETIGEYIALYQSQRKILKQKECERDAQLNRLLIEREDLRNKALQLDALIRQIGIKPGDSISSNLIEMLNKSTNPVSNNEIIEQQNNVSITNGHHINDPMNAELISAFRSEQNKYLLEQQNNNTQLTMHSRDNISESDTMQIVEKIRSLVSDLKNNQDTLPLISSSVDHCACCSGTLETI